MKINTHLLRKLREEKAWSQEHLASITGLSPRTVQRIEASGKASAESRMAIASVFGVAPASLNDPGSDTPSVPDSARTATLPAPRFYEESTRRLVVYLLVCSVLIVVDFYSHGAVTWARWPLLGWGLGIALRSLSLWRHRASIA